MKDFNSIGLPEALLKNLHAINFNTPTPIQAQAIPLALEGKDIIGSAQTGTGKTGAFSIPLVTKILNNPEGTALVLTPTRELARQVLTQIKLLIGKSKINTGLLIGGEPMPPQLSQLRSNPRIVVGTPGRVNDHLKRKSLKLKACEFLVLDETDRMLDMGFSIQIDEIIKHMPSERQTLLFSATIPYNIDKMAEKYLSNPEKISVSPASSPATNVKQEKLDVKKADKYSSLLVQLIERKGSVIIFVNTKRGTEEIAKKLYKDDIDAKAIHGDLRQNKRDRVIDSFRKKKYRILVATDVAARGLDIPHIEHVINYDLPVCPEDYIHRIGRTARAGAEGSALNLITPQDGQKWQAIDRLLNPDSKRPREKSSGSRFGDNRRSGGGKRSGGGSRFGDNKRSGGGSRFGDNKRSDSSSRFGDNKRSDSSSRFGDNKRSDSSSRFGDNKRSDSSSRFGDNKRSGSDGRSGDKFSMSKKPRFKKAANDS